MHRRLNASAAELSADSAKSVPIWTPSAPSACAASMARPLPIPPAASNGSDVARRTCGMSAIVVVSSRPLWPPASKPSATTASTPASSHLRAKRLLETTWATVTPASWSIGVNRLGLPAEVNTIFTPLSMMSLISRSISGYISGTLTPHGRSVACFVFVICS